MTIEKAKELARKNLAGIVAAMDLEKLYGTETADVEADHEVLTLAQQWLVSRLSIGWE